jgi:dihydroneopterin aldolase
MSDLSKNAAIHMAHILFEGIEIDIEVGIDPQEHGRFQRLLIDVEVGFDDKKTRVPDSEEGLKDGFDYTAIRNCVVAATRTKTYLIETIANRIADAILALPNALTCSVKVGKKRCWTNVAITSIKISRSKDLSV